MNFHAVILFALTLTSFQLMACSYETKECGSRYIHVYYGGGVGGYRIVVLNGYASMSWKGVDDYRSYRAGDDRKVVFENDNPIGVLCGNTVTFVTDSNPVVNSASNVVVDVVQPYQLIDLDSTKFDIIIR